MGPIESAPAATVCVILLAALGALRLLAWALKGLAHVVALVGPPVCAVPACREHLEKGRLVRLCPSCRMAGRWGAVAAGVAMALYHLARLAMTGSM